MIMTEDTLGAAERKLYATAFAVVHLLRSTPRRLKTRTFQTKSLESMKLSAEVQSQHPMKKVGFISATCPLSRYYSRLQDFK